MQEKRKRFIAMFLSITMVLSILAPSVTEAARIDAFYKQFIEQLVLQTGKTWFRPEPRITATLPDGSVTSVGPESTYSNDGNEWIESIFNVDKPHIKVPIGTKINLDSSASTVGSGSKIDEWDWQIYGQQNTDASYDDKPIFSSSKITSFTPTKPGTYGIYLNVKDDYILSSKDNPDLGFPNWSDLGNFKAHHTDGSRIIKNGKDELNIKDWYFTMLVIEVEDGLDIKTDTIISTPQIVTGNKVEIKTVYSIHNVKSAKDKEKFLNMDYDATVKSPLFGEKKYS